MSRHHPLQQSSTYHLDTSFQHSNDAIFLFDEDQHQHQSHSSRINSPRSSKRSKSTKHTRAASVALSSTNNASLLRVDNPRLLQSDDAAFGLISPPSSQSFGDSHAARSLISPPPEEILRSGSRHSVRLLIFHFM